MHPEVHQEWQVFKSSLMDLKNLTVKSCGSPFAPTLDKLRNISCRRTFRSFKDFLVYTLVILFSVPDLQQLIKGWIAALSCIISRLFPPPLIEPAYPQAPKGWRSATGRHFLSSPDNSQSFLILLNRVNWRTTRQKCFLSLCLVWLKQNRSKYLMRTQWGVFSVFTVKLEQVKHALLYIYIINYI